MFYNELNPIEMSDFLKELIEYTPIENFFKGNEKLNNQMVNIQAWKYFRDIFPNETLYKKCDILSSLLEKRPDKYVNYEYRNAVWSIILEELHFLFLYSNKGIEILVSPSSPQSSIERIMDYLEKLMIGNSKKTIF